MTKVFRLEAHSLERPDSTVHYLLGLFALNVRRYMAIKTAFGLFEVARASLTTLV